MNGVEKDTLKDMSYHDKVNGLIDMVYELHKASLEYLKGQPEKCGKKFIKVRYVKVAGAIIILSLLFGGAIKLATAFRLLPFL